MALRDQIEKLRNYFIEDDEEFDEPVRPQVRETAASSNPKPAQASANQAEQKVNPANNRPLAASRPQAQQTQASRPKAAPKRTTTASFTRPKQERTMQQQVNPAMPAANQTRSIIAIKEPKAYSDIMESARIVKNGEAVLVNFKFMTDSQARRSIDFLTGVVFTLDGDIQNAGGQLFIVTPATVTIDAERELSALTEGYDLYN